jgi:hypothetical protein
MLWNQEMYHRHLRILQFTNFNLEIIHMERYAYGIITSVRLFVTMTPFSNTWKSRF